jgi:hypothetical protein
MSSAFERLLSPVAGRPAERTERDRAARLNIAVVFTSVHSTLAALRRAGELASRLGARITLVVPQIVPYPLPLESPPVLLDFSEKRFRLIAEQIPVETTVRLFLCRDRLEMLTAELAPRSLVVMGGKKCWWRSAEKRLARALRRQGHEVVFTETE